MQQLTFLEAGKVEWREVDAPALEHDRQAIVRPLSVATCDLDTALMHGRAPYRGPFGLGHEGVAEEVEGGGGGDGLEPGPRVTMSVPIFFGEGPGLRQGWRASLRA